MSNKIFVDLGTHKGQTVQSFYKKQLVDDPETYDQIYCFEPQDFSKEWEELKKNDNRLCFIKKAAWIYDGEIDFSFIKDDVSSTLFNAKVDYKFGKISKVPCIDFTQFIRQFRKDFVLLKMNIEGAEFTLLYKMIYDSSIKYVDKLLVEWHDTKTVPPMTDKRYELEKKLKELKIDYHSWRRANT